MEFFDAMARFKPSPVELSYAPRLTKVAKRVFISSSIN
jgi:hypothetical protein